MQIKQSQTWMLLLLVGIFTLLSAVQIAQGHSKWDKDKEDPCPGLWRHFNGSCYLLGGLQRLYFFKECNGYCSARGAWQISIHSQEEQDFVYWTFVQPLGAPGGDDVWAGAHDMIPEGIWKWKDGTPWDYSNWMKGQPDNFGNGDCLYISGRYEGQWDDAPCRKRQSSRKYCICKRSVEDFKASESELGEQPQSGETEERRKSSSRRRRRHRRRSSSRRRRSYRRSTGYV